MTEEEVWKDVVGYEGLYEVSNHGRVKSVAKIVQRSSSHMTCNVHILKQNFNSCGYLRCRLSKDGVIKNLSVHRIVAFAFLEYPSSTFEKYIVDHISGIKINNRSDNLRFVTQRENATVCFRKNSEKQSSKYAGVSLKKRTNKWIAFIRVNKDLKYIGSFEKESDADPIMHELGGVFQWGNPNFDIYNRK